MCSETQRCIASYVFLLLRQRFCFLVSDWLVAWCFDTVWTFYHGNRVKAGQLPSTLGPWDCASYGNYRSTMHWPNVTASQLPVRPVLPWASISRLRAPTAFVSPTDPASSILWLLSTSWEWRRVGGMLILSLQLKLTEGRYLIKPGMNSNQKDRAAITQQAACLFFSFSFVVFLEI